MENMNWGKAGRPKVTKTTKKQVKEVCSSNQIENEEKWTKEELTLYNHGLYALAVAVVNQWVKDGKPKSGEAGLIPWLNVIEQVENSK